MSRPLTERPNLVTSREEHWKPPRYAGAQDSFATEMRARVMRFFDLQAGTIWADLARELPRVTGTVVDVGCGLQPFRRLFGEGVKYIGIDYAGTRRHFSLDAPDTIYYSGDHFPLEAGTADFILCTETLEHVLDVRVFLSEIVRCLKPGGRVLLTVPFAARWHFIPYDYWRPTPSAIDHLLRSAGLTDVGVYGRGNQLTVACQKGMAFIFSLLSPRPSNLALEWLCRSVGAAGVPAMVGLAVLANATMGWPGAVDFLGFTATARRPA